MEQSSSVNAYTREGETTVCSVTERVITHYPDPPGHHVRRVVPFRARSRPRRAGDRRGSRWSSRARDPPRSDLHAASHWAQRGSARGDRLPARWWARSRRGAARVRHLAVSQDPRRRARQTGLGGERARERSPRGRHRQVLGRAARAGDADHRARRGADLPGVVAAEVYVDVGGTVHPLTDGSKRVGHALAFGKDRNEAEERASLALRTIRVETE